MSEYKADLARIHHEGFGDFAERAAPGLLEMLWRAGIRDGLVVDAGCGSGIWARELTRAGFSVFGFDASPAMIAIAREIAPAASFSVAAVEEVSLPRCAAVTAIGEILNYGSTVETVRDFFLRVHAALQPGGLFVFDLAEPSDAHLADRKIEGDDWIVLVHKSLEGDVLTRRITSYRQAGEEVRRSEETHSVRLYDRKVVAAMLREAGFQVKVRRSYGSARLPEGHAVFVAAR